MNIKFFLHGLLRLLGVDIVRKNKVPESTLLGLLDFDIHTVLDIGANIGQSARSFRKLFPEAMIYCFEPLPLVFSQLNDWTQSQNSKVVAFEVALGEENKPMIMKEHVKFSPSSSFLESTSICLRVPMSIQS